MKLSLYTFVRNGLFYDFHVEAMLRHHLPFADEIIVNEGYSDDGTFEAIRGIDPKIQVHRFEWNRSDPNGWHRHFKNQARELCTGDWCVLLDCDEFIPEWEFDRLRTFLEQTPDNLVPVRFYHFYGNYKVYMAKSRTITPATGIRIHRNTPDVEVWGDGANVRIRGTEGPIETAAEMFDVHHFGNVRDPARLRQKWRVQARQHNPTNPAWDKTPAVLFDLFPHKWDDAEFMQYLAIYEGRCIKAVRENPDEFVRDNFWLYDHLRKSAASVRA